MNTMKRTNAGILFSTITIGALLGGCASSETAAEQQDFEQNLVPSSFRAGTYALPLDAVLSPDSNEERERASAIHEGLSSCMEQQGIDYGPFKFTYDQSADSSAYFGVTDKSIASEFGYRKPLVVQEIEASAASSGLDDAVNEESFAQALYGPEESRIQVKDDFTGAVVANYDPESCFGKTMDTVRPGWGQEYGIEDLSNQIALDAYRASYANEAVQDGFKEWSSCMSVQGFAFAEPDAAYTSVWPGETAGIEEIQTAVADAECKESTGLGKIWSAKIARLQTESLKKYPGLVEKWLEIRKQQFAALKESE